MTVAVLLSTLPPALLTRAQYGVVVVSTGVMNVLEFVPTGVEVSPEAP